MILIDIDFLKALQENASCIMEGFASGQLQVRLPGATAEENARLTETVIESQEMIIEHIRAAAYAAIAAGKDAIADGLPTSDEVVLMVPATPIEA
tara:strand:+ start:201 stop:485 length:285 start_codon:yes stop_codon:yes gene_type:complete